MTQLASWSHGISRRTFVHGTAASVATAALGSSAHAASDRIGVGLIGFGLIGKRHVVSLKELPEAQIVAVAEAHGGRLAEAAEFIGGDVEPYRDFRQLLDNRRVDAVVIATPDQWHALMTMRACAAGKDVYVEKPVTLFPREGTWMLDAARRHQRIVQVGTQQRSGPHYQRARELIQSGHIGRIVSVRMQSYRNIIPGFGSPPDGEPPADFDWEMFLGPAPLRKYNPNRGLYHFRWFWDYSGGQMTNLGHHSLDILDWFLGGPKLRSVCSVGGRFALRDNGETPDTQDALYDFSDFTAIWSHREVSRGSTSGSGLEFFGTKGSLSISRAGFIVTPDKRLPPENAIPQFTGAHPVGGPRSVPDVGPARFWCEPIEDKSGDARDQFVRHMRNFLASVRSREQPVSDLSSGQRVSTLCHLANISLRLGRQVRWDSERETIPNDDEAARMLTRGYRSPWDKEFGKLTMPNT